MKNYPKYIKNTLNSVIRDMAKHLEDFCRSPEKDFTRNRKLCLSIRNCIKRAPKSTVPGQHRFGFEKPRFCSV